MSCHKTEMRSCPVRTGPARSLALMGRILGVSLLALTLANCANTPDKGKGGNKYGVKASPKVIQDGEPVPKGGGYDMVGKPYTVAGKLYVPKEVKGYSATGTASWYGPQFHGRLTANGEVFDRDSVSIAHPTMPLPSYVRVTNMLNGRSIIARANDRGPYHDDRLVDVSEQVAGSLGFKHLGTARVRVDYLGRAPMEGDDDGMLLATLSDNWRPAQLGRAFPQKTQVASTAAFAPQTPPASATAPATTKPAPAVALPSRPPAAPAKGTAAKVIPGQKTAPAHFMAQVPGKPLPGKTAPAKSVNNSTVKPVLAKGPQPAKPTQISAAKPSLPAKPTLAKPAAAQAHAAPTKAAGPKAMVAQVQTHKPASAVKNTPVKTQAGKPAAKTPDKAKSKTDPHKPQTA